MYNHLKGQAVLVTKLQAKARRSHPAIALHILGGHNLLKELDMLKICKNKKNNNTMLKSAQMLEPYGGMDCTHKHTILQLTDAHVYMYNHSHHT